MTIAIWRSPSRSDRGFRVPPTLPVFGYGYSHFHKYFGGRRVRKSPECGYFESLNWSRWANERYVYFIQSVASRHIKIGVSSSLEGRFRSFSNVVPGGIRILAITPGGEDIEGWLHTHFARLRINGEWFLPHDFLRYWCYLIRFFQYRWAFIDQDTRRLLCRYTVRRDPSSRVFFRLLHKVINVHFSDDIPKWIIQEAVA